VCVYGVLVCMYGCPSLRSIDVVRFLGRGVGMGWRGVSYEVDRPFSDFPGDYVS
jgi:hypothetical protein